MMSVILILLTPVSLSVTLLNIFSIGASMQFGDGAFRSGGEWLLTQYVCFSFKVIRILLLAVGVNVTSADLPGRLL